MLKTRGVIGSDCPQSRTTVWRQRTALTEADGVREEPDEEQPNIGDVSEELNSWSAFELFQ